MNQKLGRISMWCICTALLSPLAHAAQDSDANTVSPEEAQRDFGAVVEGEGLPRQIGGQLDCVCGGSYEVGDRVVSLVNNPGNSQISIGDMGTVICGETSFLNEVLVEWDNVTNGHDGNGFCACGDLNGAPGSNAGWYMACNEIAPVCPGSGSCFEANGTPGCSNSACCETVCASDPFCCDTEWDGICASSAFSECGNCGGADAGSCFNSNGTVGCNDADCCETVCSLDTFCCTTSWDNLCAQEAADSCDVLSDNCFNAKQVFKGTTIFGDLTNATSDGATTCGSSGGNPDAWYLFVAPTDGILFANTCGTHDGPGEDMGMDTVLSAHSGCPGTADNTIACDDDNGPPACEFGDTGILRDSAIMVPMTTGQAVRLRVSHFGSSIADGAFVLNIDFEVANDDCVDAIQVFDGDIRFGNLTNATNDGASTCGGSDAATNPDVWYSFTAPANGMLFANTCGTHDGPGVDQGMDTVLSAHSGCPGTPGNTLICDDDAGPPPCPGGDTGILRDSSISLAMNVGQTVYLRLTHFGSNIQDGAFRLNVNFEPAPLDCGSPETGSCYVENGSPFCNDAKCCETVCGLDSFCCSTEWDGLCVAEAAEFCAGCGTDDAGSCFEANGTTGCEDIKCCTTVCAIDTFCCEIEWDGLCADAAIDLCNSCPADLNLDGIVDTIDLLIMLGAWGFCVEDGSPCIGDLNGDFVVDTIDLLILLGAWGACPFGPPDECAGGWTCGDPLIDCGEEGCFCVSLFGGGHACIQESGCGTPCPDGTCPPGWLCTVDTCCGFAACGLPCGEDPPIMSTDLEEPLDIWRADFEEALKAGEIRMKSK